MQRNAQAEKTHSHQRDGLLRTTTRGTPSDDDPLVFSAPCGYESLPAIGRFADRSGVAAT